MKTKETKNILVYDISSYGKKTYTFSILNEEETIAFLINRDTPIKEIIYGNIDPETYYISEGYSIDEILKPNIFNDGGIIKIKINDGELLDYIENGFLENKKIYDIDEYIKNIIEWIKRNGYTPIENKSPGMYMLEKVNGIMKRKRRKEKLMALNIL